MVEYLNIFRPIDRLGQERFDVFPVDFDVPLSPEGIGSRLILQNDQAQFFQLTNDTVEPLSHRQYQIVPNNARRVPADVLQIVLRRFSCRDIGVDGVHTCCKAAAAPDVGFFCDQHRQPLMGG